MRKLAGLLGGWRVAILSPLRARVERGLTPSRSLRVIAEHSVSSPQPVPLMPPSDERSSADASGARRLRVLCAEDHDQVAELIRLIVARAGHDVECTVDGAQALDRIVAATVPYDVVITDHCMPTLDGLGLVRASRAAGFTGRIIVQSARLSPQDKIDYGALGVTHFIAKPVRPETLRKLLAEI